MSRPPASRRHWLHSLLAALQRLLFTPANPAAGVSPRARGIRAEELARDYLLGRGYRLRERNWTCRRGELDLIVERDGCVVVVEVKSGQADDSFRPAMHINPAKQRQLWKLTEDYLKQSHLLGHPVRVDVIEVIYHASGPPQLEHLEAAVPDIRNWH